MKQRCEVSISAPVPPSPWWVRIWCVVFGHVPKDYCEPVRHYEIRCKRCGGIDMWIGHGKDPTR